MQKKLKAVFVILLVLLFFFIVNQFFRENKLLLKERNNWQEKALLFAEQIDRLRDDDGRPLTGEVVGREVSIQKVEIVAQTFFPEKESRLAYTCSVTLANKALRRMPPTAGLVFLVALTPGGEITRTAWRILDLPGLAPGETRELLVSGDLPVEPGEDLILYVDLPEYSAGPVKKRVPLAGSRSGASSFAPDR